MKELNFSVDIKLHPTPPFNFRGTVHKPSHFPESDLKYEENTYWQTLHFKGEKYGIQMQETGTANEPEVNLVIFSDEKLTDNLIKEISTEIKYRFDMNSDLAGFYESCGSDELLSPVLKKWKGMRVSSHVSLYEYLVVSTVLQNATVKRSVQMLENLFQKFGESLRFNKQKLSSFWPAKSIDSSSEEELRDLKLGYRAKTLKRQAAVFIDGKIKEKKLREKVTEKLKDKLLSIYGIGPASVQNILFEVFKEYGFVNHIPPWEQKIYSRLLFNEEEKPPEVILQEVDNRWGEWKSLAMHYLFEDLFWRKKQEDIPWLEELIRL